MNRITLLLACFFTATAPLGAQNGYWEEVPGPYGGYCSLTKTNTGSLYALYGSVDFLVYRSDDGGEHWQELTAITDNDQVTYGTFVIGGTGRFFNRIGSDWYTSVDDGENWTLFAGNNPVDHLVELQNGVIVGYNATHFYRSADAGLTWEQTSDYPAVDNRFIQTMRNTPFGGILAEAGVFTGDTTKLVYHSTDEGQTWKRIAVPLAASGIFIAPSGSMFFGMASGLHRSTNGGDAFVFVDSIYTTGDQMTALPSGRLLALSDSRLFYSDDDGDTWQPANVGYGNWNGFQQIAPLDDGSIFSQILGALHKSGDGGLNWVFSSLGIRRAETGTMRFLSDSVFFAATAAGLWKTADAGENWARLTENETIQNGGAFEVTASGGIVVVRDDKLLWSATGNAPFSDVTPPDSLITPGINSVFLNPFTNQIFINTRKGLARSDNFGQQWTPLQDSFFLNAMGFHPSGRIIAVKNYTTIEVSDNGGSSWTSASIPNAIALGGVRVAPDGTAYVVAVFDNNKAAFAKSVNAGDSWTVVPGDIGNVHFWTNDLLEIAANGHIFRSDGGKNLYRSADGGLSWQKEPDLPFNPNLSFTVTGIAISPGQHVHMNTKFLGGFRTVDPVTSGAWIAGRIRRDADADCSTPDAQEPVRNWIVKADGNFDYYTASGADGRYVFFVDTGVYEVGIRPPNDLLWSTCDSLETVVADSLFAADSLDFAAIALADCPLMSVELGIPWLRRCFDNTLYVLYCNQGSETADSAWVDVALDPYLSLVGSGQPYADLGNNTYRFFVGDVESGVCDQFSFTAYVDCDSTVIGQTHCVEAHAFPDTLCIPPPNWSGAEIVASAVCQDTVVTLELSNQGPAASQILDYIIIEDDVVLMSGEKQYAPGETIMIDVPANGHTWRVESQQEPGHPFSVQAVAFREGCGGFASLGFVNQFNVNTFQPSWDQMCLENTGSFDPNDKQGFPLGTKDEHFIRPGQELEYLIRFQNTGTDTAFTVVVRDTLSAWLDPASVHVGAASHPYTWELGGQGILTFTFNDILLPDSNVNEAASHGFVSFRIAQQPVVPIGTQIFNAAAIYFDFNPPVITNTTLHTVGVDYLTGTQAPVSGARSHSVLVSPNPVADEAVFSMKNGVFRQHLLTVADARGTVVRSVVVSGAQYLFRREGLPAGVYFFRVDDAAGQRVDAGKIVLRQGR